MMMSSWTMRLAVVQRAVVCAMVPAAWVAGAILFEIPVGASLQLDDVAQIDFDGKSAQAAERMGIYRLNAAKKDLIFFRLRRELPDGEHVFDLASSRDFLTTEIHQHRGPATDPFPGCYEGPAPAHVWQGVAGKVTIRKQSQQDDRETERFRKGSWELSVRIEDFSVRSAKNQKEVRVKDVNFQTVLMRLGPFGG